MRQVTVFHHLSNQSVGTYVWERVCTEKSGARTTEVGNDDADEDMAYRRENRKERKILLCAITQEASKQWRIF